MSDARLVAALGVGVLGDSDAPVLAADDLGLTRGDGCFDATRLVVGPDGSIRVDHLDAHLARFARSAEALGLTVDEAAWRELIAKALAAWTTPGESVLRVMLTRGRESGGPPTGLLTIAPLDERTITARQGITVVTLPRGHASDAFGDAPWLLGGIKTLSYAVNMAAGREAARRGADDVLFVSSDGFALEGPRAALVWRTGDRLATTRLDGTGVLASITQAAIFEAADATGISTAYELIGVDALLGCDGAWLVSSGRLVAPMRALDGRPLAHDAEWTDRIRRLATP
jgi:4-amino-4-deoxychorismate lyase